MSKRLVRLFYLLLRSYHFKKTRFHYPFFLCDLGFIEEICKYLHMNADKQSFDLNNEYIDLAVEVFSMLADPTRLRIVMILNDSERSVNEIAGMLGKQPASVSQHLAKLRMARIVQTRQEGQRVFYRVANEHVSQLAIDALYQAEHSVEVIPRHHRAG